MIKKIFTTIGTTNRYFVEFGVENGMECNTRYLREFYRWSGLMMDGSNENLSINLHKEFITAENINPLFEKYGVPEEFDLLSIDLDFNDFYIWKALDKYRPRVVIIEYNPSHLPNDDKVVIYDPTYMWDFTNYYGSSILSLTKLGALKGYTLIYVEKNAVNLFFVRNDLLTKFQFKNAGNVEKLYKSRLNSKHYNPSGPSGGSDADPYNRPYLTYEEACLCGN